MLFVSASTPGCRHVTTEMLPSVQHGFSKADLQGPDLHDCLPEGLRAPETETGSVRSEMKGDTIWLLQEKRNKAE